MILYALGDSKYFIFRNSILRFLLWRVIILSRPGTIVPTSLICCQRGRFLLMVRLILLVVRK
ncbi:MAG: hypothetical protein [Chaetfec virus UA24_2563]|nr:MAG: hypothetical protein [Chaetfec virus UA24_2563]